MNENQFMNQNYNFSGQFPLKLVKARFCLNKRKLIENNPMIEQHQSKIY